MKAQIHPQYFQASVRCACGNTFTTGSTVEEIKVDICSACHPFYTGQMKFVDTAGRVDKFKTRLQAQSKKVSKKEKRLMKKQAKIEEERSLPTSLADIRNG
ncbi:MAG: 50S ribosomal protein L31 [bacterium]|nr:50S ribosomal protein L31 [bacterium]